MNVVVGTENSETEINIEIDNGKIMRLDAVSGDVAAIHQVNNDDIIAAFDRLAGDGFKDDLIDMYDDCIEQMESTKKRKSKSNNSVKLAIAVILLLIIATSYYFFF